MLISDEIILHEKKILLNIYVKDFSTDDSNMLIQSLRKYFKNWGSSYINCLHIQEMNYESNKINSLNFICIMYILKNAFVQLTNGCT